MLRYSALSRSVSNSTAMMARLMIAGLRIGLLVAIFAGSLIAQRANESISPRRSVLAYDPAHELALDGTVQEVVSQHEIGSPAGLHLIVSGETGTVDAHLGPFMTQETREALHMGLPVHVVGEMKEFHGKPIMLARLITFGGRTVIVRSPHGALVLYPSHPAAVTPGIAKSANGGSR
jgi:hypothetical protein